MGNILIIVEQEEGNIKKYSKELAHKASEIAKTLGSEVDALLFGAEAADDAATLGNFGVKKVTVIGGDSIANYTADQYIAEADKVIADMNPEYVFASASSVSKDLLPRLAAKKNSGMATECIDLIVDNGAVTFRRPIYAGKAWVDLKINSEIKFATLRPNVFSIGEPTGGTAEVVNVDAAPVESKTIIKERIQSEEKQVDLVEANVIVAGGRAIGNADNFKMLHEMADELNASIGASRAAVDAGYISHDHQVGQTGKTVNPSLYIACGISGAIQHLAGMRTAKIIVAINKDPDAPIFTKADFGIVGDLFKVIPAITEKLKKLSSQ